MTARSRCAAIAAPQHLGVRHKRAGNQTRLPKGECRDCVARHGVALVALLLHVTVALKLAADKGFSAKCCVVCCTHRSSVPQSRLRMAPARLCRI